MSLADIFKRKPKQLDADPEDGDGSEMMAGNEAVRKKQILLMSGGAAIALVLGSWYIMDDDKAELVTDASGKETRIATDDMVNKNMSQREWQAASEAQMQSMNNQLKSVDGQAAQMRALQEQVAALQGQNSSMASDGQRVMGAYQQENDQLRQQLAARSAPAPAPVPAPMYGPMGPQNYRGPSAPMTAGEAAAAAVASSRQIKLVADYRPRRMRLAGVLATASLMVLSSCTTFGTNIKGSFACGAPEGGSCAPATVIDDKALLEITGDTSFQPAGPFTVPAQRAAPQRVAFASSAPAAMSPQKVLRIVFPAHVDALGRFHETSVVQAMVDNGQWLAATNGQPRQRAPSCSMLRNTGLEVRPRPVPASTIASLL